MRRLVGVFLAFLLLPLPASPQSLAELAKKEKERRKRTEKAGAETKVIKEDDLKQVHGGLSNEPSKRSASPSSTSAPAGDASASDPDATTSDLDRERAQRQRQEDEWRRRMAAARQRVEKAKKNLETLEGLFLVGGERYVDSQGNTVIRDLDHLREIVASAKAEVAAAEKAVADLEERARRAHVPPGWLR